MSECSKPDCVEARRQRDAYRSAGPALAQAIVIAIAQAALNPLGKDFTAADVVYLVYQLLNEPRSGALTPEDIEIQNLTRVKIDALINGGTPSD